MASTNWSFYCANCIHYPVCKLTQYISQNDNANRTFNTQNFDKNRIQVISVSYDCRYKRTSSQGGLSSKEIAEFKKINDEA